MGEPPESELGAGGLPPNRPPETTEEGKSGTATIEDCVGLGKFSNILVRTLVLLPLGLGLRLPRPTGLPTTLVPRLAHTADEVAGASTAIKDSSISVVDVRSSAALSNTEGTPASIGSVVLDLGVRCGLLG